ncbi:MAG: metallophosphoesterase [Bacteroidales bacterium]
MDRRKFMKQSVLIGLMGIIGSSAISSCKKIFDYSPVMGNSDSHYYDMNIHHIEQINSVSPKSTNRLSIALIADNHKNLDEMADIVSEINTKANQIDFTVHMGDITDEGLAFEYQQSLDILNRLEVPFFVVLGNHDCLGNGKRLYTDYYGVSDFSFSFGPDYFIFFNDVIWELGNRTPNFSWLENELKKSLNYRNRFVFSHIPPYTDQFIPENKERFMTLMKTYEVQASIHGHQHSFEDMIFDQDITRYIQVPFTRLNSYLLLDIEQNKIDVTYKKML